MAIKLEIPPIVVLEKLRKKATRNGKTSEEKWVEMFCDGHSSMILKDPGRYRTYGPYWWVMKDAFIKRGITDFGDYVDPVYCDLCTYDTPFHTFLAAWLYGEQVIKMGMMYSYTHYIGFIREEGGTRHVTEYKEYLLTDRIMEVLYYRQKTQQK